MGKHTFMKAAGAAAAVGAVIGAAAGAVKVINDVKEGADAEVSRTEKEQFSKLLSQQYVTDLFTASEAKEWFISRTQQETDPVTMYICRFTEAIARQFHIQEAQILDEDHYILQVIQNDRTKEIIAMRLINLGELPPKFQALLDENDGKAAFER